MKVIWYWYNLLLQVRQEARELQSKYCELASGSEPNDPESKLFQRASKSKRVSVPENFSYFSSGQSLSLQMQLAHHRLNQKRQILQKQRPGDASGGRHRNHVRPQSYVKPYLPTDCLSVAPQGSDCLFQPIAEDEPSTDTSHIFHENSNSLKIEVFKMLK